MNKTWSMANRERKARAKSSASFFWQGVLIILPAVVLTGIGFFSVYRDRMLAGHEARAQAESICNVLAEEVIPLSFTVNTLPEPDSFFSGVNQTSYSLQDPLERLRISDRIELVCLLDHDRHLVYPPSFKTLPVPDPIQSSVLTEPQQKIWNEYRAARAAADSEREAKTLRLLAADPESERLHYWAQYRLGILALAEDRLKEGQTILQKVSNADFKFTTEIGLPLAILAKFRLLEINRPDAGNFAPDAINMIARYAISNPTSMSSYFLEETERLSPGSRVNLTAWRNLWRLHEKSRSLGEAVIQEFERGSYGETESPSPFWFTNHDSEKEIYLVVPQRSETEVWYFAWTEAFVRKTIASALKTQTIPDYFGVHIEMAGKTIGNAMGESEKILAKVMGFADTEETLPFITAQVFLASPGQLFDRQRSRLFCSALLVAVSAGAVFTGFLAAWRAFRRQRDLREMMSNFVSSVTHEMRAPIASVCLMAEQMNHEADVPKEKSRKYHRFIIQECRRLSNMINNVLDFSMHDRDRKEYSFELSDLLAMTRETVALLEPNAMEKQMILSVVDRGQPKRVWVDKNSIQQVLINLVDNAIKHGPKDGKIEVGLHFPDDDNSEPRTEEGLCVFQSRKGSRRLRKGSRVTIWVEDGGAGIPTEEQKCIFEQFYRRGSEFQRETQGVGLGLVIVQYVVEAHGGEIYLRSAPGEGSRFSVVLPLDGPEHKD